MSSWWVFQIIRQYEQKNGVDLTDLCQAISDGSQQQGPFEVVGPDKVELVERSDESWFVTLRDGRRIECSTVLCADSVYLLV